MKLIMIGIVFLIFIPFAVNMAPQHDIEIAIPEQSEWVDYGIVVPKGDLGEWDYQMFGGFTATSIKKDGLYYLYYQGASGYRTSYDETVTWRAIGVATSPDGVNFTKAENNPIINWFPNQGEEEGAVSGSVVTYNEQFAMVYGANTLVNTTQVNADGRLTISNDGINYLDHGIILDHQNQDLWGSRDEIFPVIAIQEADRTVVYYIPNGSIVSGKLGVAWGNNFQNLTHSNAVRNGFNLISVWGAASQAKIGVETYALFLSNVRERKIDVHTVSLATPQRISSPVRSYQFDNVQVATVLLDRESHTWFMYYRNEEGYGLKLAPAGEIDNSPPSPPDEVVGEANSDHQITLQWKPGIDEESGIVEYQVFRDGQPIAKVKGWRFLDTGLDENTSYGYQIVAINYHGVKSHPSETSMATTMLDHSPPEIKSVSANGEPQSIHIIFNEPIDPISAVEVENYHIEDIPIDSINIGENSDEIFLNASGHLPDQIYQLNLANIYDQALTPNTISQDTSVQYSFSLAPGLVGYWKFEEGFGDIANDMSNYGNNGELIYTDKSGPTWDIGISGGGLLFDGLDDQVTIEDSASLMPHNESFTFSAWAKPNGLPSNTTPNDTYFTIMAQDYTGLYFGPNGEYRAHVQLENGNEITLSTPNLGPDEWHQVTLVVDNLQKTVHFYIDGEEVTGSPVIYQGDLANRRGKPFYIGSSEPLTERYEYRFWGLIDEVKVYNKAIFP